MEDVCEISGIIVDVITLNEFKIKCVDKEKNIIVKCQFNCPVMKNDCIYAVVKLLPDGKYDIIKLPFFLIAKDKESIITKFIIYLKIKYPEAKAFYDSINNVEENVY